MAKYKTKVEYVEAYQITNEFINDKSLWPDWITNIHDCGAYLTIDTIYGSNGISTGDYIVKIGSYVHTMGPVLFKRKFEEIQQVLSRKVVYVDYCDYRDCGFCYHENATSIECVGMDNCEIFEFKYKEE